ncbi:hypothetical protein Leryth_020635 [Lithospermum erythrorhizon]|nr:hypothetical protein Leryth_020635 [Lithospermum erythrorhizon]
MSAIISQFFVLSQRGDNIVFRDYWADIVSKAVVREIFFPESKNVDGVNYFHVKVVGLLFVATTRASFICLNFFRIHVIKDYLGFLNEEALRKNFKISKNKLDEVGYILTSEIDGTIQMKSYLSGNPEVRLALNDEVSIGRGGRSGSDLKSTSRVCFQHHCKYYSDTNAPSNIYKQIVGGSEHTLRAKLTFSQELHGNITKEAGPVSMTFIIHVQFVMPVYLKSNLCSLGEVFADSKDVENLQSISMGAIYHSGQFLCRSSNLNVPKTAVT